MVHIRRLSLPYIRKKSSNEGDFSKLSPQHSQLRGMDFHDGDDRGFANEYPPLPSATFAIALTPQPTKDDFQELDEGGRRLNVGEQRRLQGLMRTNTMNSSKERVAWGGTGSWPTGPGWGKRLRVWMVNEGSRRIFIAVYMVVHALIFGLAFINYQLSDNLTNARRSFGVTYSIARAAAVVLHFDVAFILLPVCRNLVSLLRRGPLNYIIPFEKNVSFHMLTAWCLVFFTIIHIVAHIVNIAWLAVASSPSSLGRLKTFALTNILAGPGWTGWVMTICLGLMSWFAVEKRRRKGFEKFYYSHHLFILFFLMWQLHGMFCMIKPDRPPYCSASSIGSFWKWWLVGGVMYIGERILREVRSRHRTYISKVILHPSRVCEIQIKKEKTVTRAGQYIFLNCPEVSFWQWHPFTLTSAPEEDYISVHIRIVGDFTTALAKALGCNLDPQERDPGSPHVVPLPANQVLPRVMIDGPFGSASEDVFNFEVVLLVGGGIGVTPFASILKSIWYRLSFPSDKRTRLQKVYFVWVCRDFDSFEWFQSLLLAIEEQDLANHIEIHTYLTAKIKDDDVNNIIIQDVGGQKDAITSLRSPTHFGRPNWDRIFQSIAERHPQTETGVFFCGPKALGSSLHQQCNKWTSGDKDGVKFVWGKENF